MDFLHGIIILAVDYIVLSQCCYVVKRWCLRLTDRRKDGRTNRQKKRQQNRALHQQSHGTNATIKLSVNINVISLCVL